MKIDKLKPALIILAAALSTTMFTGCGSPNSAPVVPGVGGVAGGQYPNGQYRPPYAQPYANGQYHPANCVAITSVIPFNGSGEVTLNTITAGHIPNSRSHGQISLGTGPAVNGQYGSTSGEGTLSLNINSNDGNRDGYGRDVHSSPSHLNGSLQLSPQTIQTIQSTQLTLNQGYIQPGSMPQYGALNNSALCVTGISLMLTYSHGDGDQQQSAGPYPESLSGEVYLYLNGSQHGYQLQF